MLSICVAESKICNHYTSTFGLIPLGLIALTRLGAWEPQGQSSRLFFDSTLEQHLLGLGDAKILILQYMIGHSIPIRFSGFLVIYSSPMVDTVC